MSVGIIASSRRYADEVLADAPAAYWRCGESSGDLADSSGNGRTLTVAGTPTYSATGLLSGDSDSAVLMDADGDYFSRADTTITAYTSAWTLEAIIRSGTSSWPEGAIVTTGYNGSHVTWALNIGYNFGVRNVAAAFYNGAWRRAGSGVLSLDTTYHVVGTWDGTNLRLYLNGQQESSATPGSTPSSTAGMSPTHNVFLGRRWDSNARFPGIIDEVAVYSTSLSAARIAAHYAASK